VHHLVARTFIGEPPGEVGPRGGNWQINHKNGDITDNRPENLEWVKREGNTAHAHKQGLYLCGEDVASSELTPKLVRWARRVRRQTSKSFREIASDLPVGKGAVKQAVRGKTWSHIEKPPPIPS